jgi:hypothetical protein
MNNPGPNSLFDAVKQGDLHQAETILEAHPQLVNQIDNTGATALHYAALYGYTSIARLLINKGADVNAIDASIGATPTGWAIEYLREMGGFLAIELDDFAYAIQSGDEVWAARFLQRFPSLRFAKHKDGKSFHEMAIHYGNSRIIALFE